MQSPDPPSQHNTLFPVLCSTLAKAAMKIIIKANNLYTSKHMHFIDVCCFLTSLTINRLSNFKSILAIMNGEEE